MSTQIEFYVLVGWNKDREPQKQDGKDKLMTSGSIPRTKTQLDSTEKQLNSSEKNSRGFWTLTFLQEIQKDLEEKNIKPENFKVRIIFMSMFNDILRKSDDQDCISHDETVKNYANFYTRTLDFSGSRVGKEMVR